MRYVGAILIFYSNSIGTTLVASCVLLCVDTQLYDKQNMCNAKDANMQAATKHANIHPSDLASHISRLTAAVIAVA